MALMARRSLFSVCVFVALLGLVLSSVAAGAQENSPKRGRKFKAPAVTGRVEVTVVRDSNGKPIENAAVIFHPMEGDKDKGNMELKTNEDGKAVIEVLPLNSTARLQIIAKGFQTYGNDYKIDKDKMTIDVRMKRPGEQYSIYKDHPKTEDGDKKPDAGTAPSAPPADATPSAKPDAPPSK